MLYKFLTGVLTRQLLDLSNSVEEETRQKVGAQQLDETDGSYCDDECL